MISFTTPDVWSGGSVEALMLCDSNTHQTGIDVARAIWSFSGLDGPYLRDDVDPQQQAKFNLLNWDNDNNARLYGVMTYQDGTRSPAMQYTMSTEHGFWVYFGPTLGGLPAKWNVGAYPFDSEIPTTWLPPLLDQLRQLTEHVHQRCPLLGAMYGWLDPSDSETLLKAIASNIPHKRWNGLTIYDGPNGTYFPPTNQEPPMTIND